MFFEKAKHGDYFSGKPQMIIAKDEPLAQIMGNNELWLEYGRPVLWLQIASFADNYQTECEFFGIVYKTAQFDVYYDSGYGSYMVIVNNELVYQAHTFCEAFVHGDYAILFQEQSDRVHFYKQLTTNRNFGE